MGRKKSQLEKFLSSKFYRDIEGRGYEITEEIKTKIVDFYSKINDRDRHCRWQRHIARWIEYGVSDDWVELRKKILDIPKGQEFTLEWHKLTYGEYSEEIFENIKKEKASYFPSKTSFWIKKGFSKDDAIQKVKEYQSNASKKCTPDKQRKKSIRCAEYWLERGYNEEDAIKMVSSVQRRDLSFYQRIHGEENGKAKFKEISSKKKRTWAKKSKEEIKEHAIKTIPCKHINVMENEVIALFLSQNNISPVYCKFGTPRQQFTQYIDGVGYRRYDLAVFHDIEHKNLKYILEFHGLGHINFSDFSEDMRDKRYTNNTKEVFSINKTFGELYDNDIAKRNHIIKTYPNAIYMVAWIYDYKNKRLKIDDLL